MTKSRKKEILKMQGNAYKTYLETRIQEYKRLGLTDQEIGVITTPAGNLPLQERLIGLAVRDKLTDCINKENEIYKKEQDEKRNNLPFNERFKFALSGAN